MQNPLDFYISRKKEFELKAIELKKKLTVSGFLRLSVFLLTVYGIYLFFGNYSVVIPFLIIGLGLFIFLILRHQKLDYEHIRIKNLIDINQREIEVLNGNYSNLKTGNEFIDHDHFYSYDLDLFGEGSFFQYLNRTATLSGKNRLANKLSKNTIDAIQEKQNSTKELAKTPEWRQNFSATAKMIKVDTDSKTIVNWLTNYSFFVPKIFANLPKVFAIITWGLFALLFFKIIPFSLLVLWFFIGLAITMIYVKKINGLYQNSSLAKSSFKQYHKLLDMIENKRFESDLLQKKQGDIRSENIKASLIFKDFSKTLDALDQRNNMFFGIIGNGLFLWDLTKSYQIEQWIKTYHHKVEDWFQVIAFFDAQNSLANYVFNHPGHFFPKINNTGLVIESKNLGHPLIDKKQRIDNDFNINSKDFYIITGANMAGKSTFLRTVSLSIVMANMGLPVCADEFIYSPIKLITSMRTSDSLSKDESYFFSELKRLKFIVDELKSDNYFIVLDEILKGTNSTDKAIGSKKFVEKLVNSGSTGIIATHDLSLCEVEKDYPQIHNKYFDAEIINNELSFDYKLKKGICKNMNASFLLQKMEIV
ncbi:MAG: DNA mismatch repair protein MutS [Bacteroidota bacterium]